MSLFFILILIFSVSLNVFAEQKTGSGSIQVKVELVNVDVIVTDKKGNLITGLKAADFEIYEDKVRQEITNFSADSEAEVSVVLLVDYSKQAAIFSAYSQGEVWEIPREFINRLKDRDYMAFAIFDMRLYILVDFTRSKQELFKGLKLMGYPAWSEANLFDALYEMLDRIEENRREGVIANQRTAIVLIALGIDTFSKKSLDEVLKKVRNANVVIYAISVGGNLRAKYDVFIPPEVNIQFLQADNQMKNFAELSGGAAFFPRFITEIPSILNNIYLDLRNQYSLGYISSNKKKDGKLRKISVKVRPIDINRDGKIDKKDEIKVRHRTGYFAEKE